MGLGHALLIRQWGTPYNSLLTELFLKYLASCLKTHKNICKYFGMGPMDEQISARQSKFYLRYCATESAACHVISKSCSMTLYS